MKYNKKDIIQHLNRLIEEGKDIAKGVNGTSTPNNMMIESQAWITQVQNIFNKVFGTNSIHTQHLYNVYRNVHISYGFQVYPIIGVIKGAQNDIKDGFLEKVERRIEVHLSDDILIQSKDILNQGNKDISAILNRIVLERIIKRDAYDNGININNKKTSVLNNELKGKKIYTQPKWRQIQTYLDVGNSAAHGNFDEYDYKTVGKMIEYLEDLLAQ